MYCCHCGKEISDDSKYCQYCGKENLAYLNSNTIPNVSKLTSNHITKLENIFSNKSDVWKRKFLQRSIWITINLICLSCGKKYEEGFFPFGATIEAYDFTEFIFYVLLVPLIIAQTKLVIKKYKTR